MKRAAKLIACVFFVAGSALAQSSSSPVADGEWWRHATPASKYWYVRGIREGMAWLASMEQGADPTAKLYYGCSCSTENVVEGLDRIYSDPANTHVPVIMGIRVHVMRVNGAPVADVEEVLRETRQFWNRLTP
jgi:hypothetical protein